ncbi:sulfotransferase family 2 domain-containing protein [Novosphingobium bradum]|uniref:Sulfotransferase family 2 domain-containing protein n=2 Tax=Novosphingobium bradum TaxID=1737444 RepID=A0ABV7IQU6_9SPHN
MSGLRSTAASTIPETVRQRVRARLRAGAFRDAGVAFIHVPRTAGTSISSAVYGRFIGHFGLADLKAVGPRDVLTLPRFSVVRNPWDRLVSAWSFARAGGGDSEVGTIRIHRPAQYAVPQFATFARFVEEWLDQREPGRIDGVFRPQHGYLLDAGGAMDFTHVGRLENIGQTEAWLSATLGRPIAFQPQNEAPRTDYRAYYTPRLRDIVARIYARDIELLGYDF